MNRIKFWLLGVFLLATQSTAFAQLQPTPRDTSVVSLLFGADVYSSIEDYATQPTFALGTIGLNYFRNGWDVSLRAVALSNQNTVSSDNAKVFGRTLLTPGFGSAGVRSLYLDASSPYFSDLLKNKRSGFLRRFRLNGYLYTGAINWDWQGDNNPAKYEALQFASGLNGSYTIQTVFHQDNVLSLTFHAGFTSRFLAGEIAAAGDLGQIEQVRLETLKTTDRGFGGVEFGATLRFNWVYAKLNMTHFGGDAPGFSGLQDQISAGIITDIHITKARKWYPVQVRKKVSSRGSSLKR